MSSETLTYTEALEELNAIVAAIESGDLDVDELTKRVARAVALVSFCKEAISGAELEVSRLLEQLDEPGDT